jgi:hypothetical protein
MKGYEDVKCSICNYAQPLEQREDVQALRGQGGPGMHMQPPGPGPQHGVPPGMPKPNEPMRYQ